MYVMLKKFEQMRKGGSLMDPLRMQCTGSEEIARRTILSFIVLHALHVVQVGCH